MRKRFSLPSVLVAAAMTTALLTSPAKADELVTGPVVRGTNDGKSLCGKATLFTPGLAANSRTERKNVASGCGGGLTGSESIYANTNLMILSWAFEWERCV